MIRHRLTIPAALAVIACALASSPAAAQDPSAAEVAANANNPLADMSAFNVHNYYIPKIYGADDEVGNLFWVRAATPTGPVLWRASLPVISAPGDTPTGQRNGLGDLQLFAAYLAVSRPDLTVGFGPQFVMPTAADGLGANAWQLGAAFVVFKAVSPTFQTGGLILWQTDVAGGDDRQDTNFAAIQPFAFWQLGGGTYLRSAPIWQFDIESGNYNVPIGVGIGKVVKSGQTVFNIFLEPQYTAFHYGVGQPALQLFMGVNMQFIK